MKIRQLLRQSLQTARKILRTDRSALSGLTDSDRELILEIRSRNLTYLSLKKLASIANTCRSIEEAEIPGLFIEAGCALGGSSILIASIKCQERALAIFDVFERIPAPTEDDPEEVHDRYKKIVDGISEGIGGDKYYGYIDDLYSLVNANLQAFGIDPEPESVRLVKGLLQDTMSVDEPVAFAHIDVDWYEPVKISLERIFPRLSVGGSIILDDYHDWGGCRKATDAFLAEVASSYRMDDSAGSLKLTKTAG